LVGIEMEQAALSMRCKLYVFGQNGQWKLNGLGEAGV
jgi:hypothetical protein